MKWLCACLAIAFLVLGGSASAAPMPYAVYTRGDDGAAGRVTEALLALIYRHPDAFRERADSDTDFLKITTYHGLIQPFHRIKIRLDLAIGGRKFSKSYVCFATYPLGCARGMYKSMKDFVGQRGLQ